MSKPIEIKVTVGGIQQAKKDLDNLQDSFDKVSNDPIKAKKIKENIDLLSKSITDAEDSMKSMQVAGSFLNAKFEDIYGNIQPLTGRIGELEDRLYELALAGQQNTEEFKNIQAEVGKMKKVIIDVDKSVDLLAENQGISIFGTGLSQIGERLISLDFVGAEKDAKAFNNSLGNIGKMGQQALSGLIGTVKQLAGSFFQLGKALIMNPIFLITAVVSAIVASVVLLMNKFGLLKPILDSIGKAIQFMVDTFNWLTDAIGITDNAGETYAKNETERLTKLQAKNKEYSAEKVRGLDNEIKLLKASGKETEKVEREKQQFLIETAKNDFNILNKKINDAKILSKLSKDELKALKDQFKEAKVTLQQAKTDLQIFELEQEKERADKEKASAEKRAQKQKEIQAKIHQARIDLEKKLKQDILDNENEILAIYKKKEEDRLALMKQQETELTSFIQQANKYTTDLTLSQEELELQAIQTKYQRQLDLAEQFGIGMQEIVDAQKNEENAIRLKYEQERTKNEEDESKKRIELEKQVQDAKVDLTQQGIVALMDLASVFAQGNERQARTAFNINKSLSIAETIISTYSSAQKAYASQLTLLTPDAPVRGAIAAGIAIASGLARLSKISQTKFESKTASGGGSVGGTVPAPQQAQQLQPSVNLFGQGNQFNQASQGQNAQGNQEQSVIKAVVSEVEITATQNKISKFEQNSLL